MPQKCVVCGKEVDRLLYWQDPKFHPDLLLPIFFCGPNCSTAYEQKKKENS